MDDMRKSLRLLGLIWALALSARAQQPADSSNSRHFRHFGGEYKRSDSLQQGRGEWQTDRRSMNRFDRAYGRPGEGPGHFDRRALAIHYTRQQRITLRAIDSGYRKKSDGLYREDKLTLGEYKARLLSLQKDRKRQKDAVLTPEQKEQITSWKKRAAEESQIRAAARLERMKLRIALTDQQESSIKTEQDVLRQQMLAIRENDNLLPYQKRDAMRALHAQQEQALKSILNPVQIQQWELLYRPGPGVR
jgi:hypothetical protein